MEPDTPPQRLPGRVDSRYADEGVDWVRIFSALRRRGWIVVLVTVVGTGLGFLYARSMAPIYTAQARIWFEGNSGTAAMGPVQTGQLFENNSWQELFQSFLVLDPVVRELDLYLGAPARDSALFRAIDVADEYTPGRYTLSVDDAGAEWQLERRDAAGPTVVESGAVGEPIGRSVGLFWSPDADLLEPGRDVDFSLSTIRDASRSLQTALETNMDQDGQIMRIRLARNDPQLAANVINLAMERFLEVAAELESGSLATRGERLREQLAVAEARYDSADAALEAFRTSATGLAGGGVGLGGSEASPIQSSYFDLVNQRDALARDRRALDRALQTVQQTGSFPAQTLLGVASAEQSTEIQSLLDEIAAKRAERRDALLRYTETSPQIRSIDGEIENLETVVLPARVRDLAEELDIRIAALDQDIAARASDLQAIPARAQEEQRLVRELDLAEERFTELQNRYDQTQLAEISNTPGIQVLDRADASRRAESDPGFFIMLFSLFGSIGVATVAVLLLDRTDKRLRYPSQITRGMGLNILGGIPHLKRGRSKSARRSETELVEAFRSLRLNLDHSYGTAGPTLVTITSPDAGDGKSFITANLANAYARQGRRTVVIDADTRRGTQHDLFGGPRIPGLTGYLDGDIDYDVLVRSENGGRLAYIPSGKRSEHSPEQLGSKRMRELVSHLKADYDVILIDTPPMSAGVDPLALATLTGNLLLVLRTGETDVTLAESNLEMLDQLPVRVLGAVLNDISKTDQGYRQYGYRSDYAIEAETSAGAVESGKRLIGASS